MQERDRAWRRLSRFLMLQRITDAEGDLTRSRLVSRAVFAAYRDCIAAGLEREARELLGRSGCATAVHY